MFLPSAPFVSSDVAANAAGFNSRPPGTELFSIQIGTPKIKSGRPVFANPNPMVLSLEVTSNGKPVRACSVELRFQPRDQAPRKPLACSEGSR